MQKIKHNSGLISYVDYFKRLDFAVTLVSPEETTVQKSQLQLF